MKAPRPKNRTWIFLLALVGSLLGAWIGRHGVSVEIERLRIEIHGR